MNALPFDLWLEVNSGIKKKENESMNDYMKRVREELTNRSEEQKGNK